MSASVGCGFRSSRFTAAITIPGVQMPHCAPPQAMNASCTACNWSPLAMPSMVLILQPSACSAGTRQLLTMAPSSSTVQAPHSPSPQPSFVPVSFSSSRITSSKRAMGYACTRRFSPFTTKERSTLLALSGTRGLLPALERFHQNFGRNRYFVDADARGVLDGVDDRGRGPVHGQFADALGARRAVRVTPLLEVHADAWYVGGGGHDVVRHLVVDHAAFLPVDLFVERAADGVRHAACDLSRGEHGMDHRARFLHGNEIVHLGFV